jgi:hypothetical protein
MDKELGEFVGKGFAMLRDRLKAVEAQKATNGIDGQDGKDGTNGTDGKDGNNGNDGSNGLDGINGNDGTNGIDGQRGIKGDEGETIRGEKGDQGKTGKAGEVGPKGKDGTNGTDGTDGQTVEGKDGDDGEGIASAKVDTRGHLIVTLDSGRKIDAGKVKGRDGDSGGGGSLRPQPASEILAGLIALGTQAEVDAGTVENKAVTPKTLRDSNVARVFIGDVDIAIGETTLVHGLNLSNKNAYTVSAKINNSSVNLDVDSVDVNTIKLTSLVAATGVSITVIGA